LWEIEVGDTCTIEGEVSLDGAETKSEDCQMDAGTRVAQSPNGRSNLR
jgi:hypothetical protein